MEENVNNAGNPKYLRKEGETTLYVWNPILAERKDMIPVHEDVKVKAHPQSHLTVKQKMERGLPLSADDLKMYPEYSDYKPKHGKNEALPDVEEIAGSSDFVSDRVPPKKVKTAEPVKAE